MGHRVRTGVFVLLAGLVTGGLRAEPFMVEPAVLNKVNTLELGLAPSYRQDKFKSGGADATDTTTRYDLYGIWVPKEMWETRLTLPYVSDKLKSGATSKTNSGVGQTVVGEKYAFAPNQAAALKLEFPTGNQDKLLSEGTNIDLRYLLEGDVSGGYRGFLNAGYLLKPSFKTNFDLGGAKVKIDPGNVLYVSGALQKPYNGMDLAAEAYVALVGKSKTAGVSVPNSDGKVINLAFTATKMLQNDWKVRGGLAFGLGDEEVSSFDLARPAGDWKLLLSASRQFSLK